MYIVYIQYEHCVRLIGIQMYTYNLSYSQLTNKLSTKIGILETNSLRLTHISERVIHNIHKLSTIHQQYIHTQSFTQPQPQYVNLTYSIIIAILVIIAINQHCPHYTNGTINLSTRIKNYPLQASYSRFNLIPYKDIAKCF